MSVSGELGIVSDKLRGRLCDTGAEIRIEFYFPQRLQRRFEALRSVTSVRQLVSQRFAAPANENVPLN